jgi:type IV pilus assembly protein PilW
MNHSFTKRHTVGATGRKQAGLTVIEMLVALTIGGLLIFGATQAYVDSRNAYAINESVSRMQETARYAMSVLEPEIRMSNYWGLMKGAETISGKRKATDIRDAFGGNAAIVCGPNFALDLENNVYGWEATYGAGCPAFSAAQAGGGPMTNADTFVIRRASVTQSAPPMAAGPLRICSSRVAGILVQDTTDPACAAAGGANPTAQINDLIVNFYYIDRNSAGAPGVPSLRRYFLTATPDLLDEEVISGVEDMQVQYGVDRNGGIGLQGGAVTQYLNAGPALDALLTAANPAQIVSVRIWLLVRAETPEGGFTDERIYEYGSRLRVNGITGNLLTVADANKAYQPSLNADNTFTSVKRYRRVLVSRTINVRNALGT